MTRREAAAFNAGVEAMRQMALVAAVTIEVRDDAHDLRQRAAVAALAGLAEGASALLIEPPACIPPDINRESDPSANLLPTLTML